MFLQWTRCGTRILVGERGAATMMEPGASEHELLSRDTATCSYHITPTYKQHTDLSQTNTCPPYLFSGMLSKLLPTAASFELSVTRIPTTYLYHDRIAISGFDTNPYPSPTLSRISPSDSPHTRTAPPPFCLWRSNANNF